MLASPKVLDALKNIGLNLYERRLWVALLARGTSTAGELSEIANVPRSRAYDVLQSLADRGFVIVQTAKPIRYIAVTPEESLERAKKKLEEEVLRMHERIDELKDSPIMRELNEIFQQGLKLVSPEDMTGALKGKYSVSQQTESMFKNATQRIEIMTTAEGINELLVNHLDVLKKAKERGVEIKIATNSIEKCADAIKSLGSMAEIRAVDEKEIPLQGRFFVVDGKQMVFGLTDSKVHSTQDMVLWSKSEYAAGNVLEPLFKMIWGHSKPVS
ncbi:MAG TPA: helix-turn-helix domain-containing protein [archaeon]|nr:helix-turn-helix domain-containing protein [archaeon]